MTLRSATKYRDAIRKSGQSIYEPIEVGHPLYWIPTPDLQVLLEHGLRGLSVKGLPIRTRSKMIKARVCESLGYPVPDRFQRCRPRFLAQQLDVYVQKASNLQIWNEELSPERRYAIVQVSADDAVQAVRVVNGQELAKLDKTGTITKKYQARLPSSPSTSELISRVDSAEIRRHTGAELLSRSEIAASDEPTSGTLIPIAGVFGQLHRLVGASFSDPGRDQERNRGAILHKIVCLALGYSRFADNGQFPDVRNQLLEVKLQTASTIDLGLVLPDSDRPLDVRRLGKYQPRHKDTRYAIFTATTDKGKVRISGLYIVTGADFFRRFRRFEGKILNGKIQIPLPRDFF